jgi:hypothetical protein
MFSYSSFSLVISSNAISSNGTGYHEVQAYIIKFLAFQFLTKKSTIFFSSSLVVIQNES